MIPVTKNRWVPADDALIAELWKTGHSANEIARRLSGRSRNAVIGRLHRLGMAGDARDKPYAPKASAAAGRRPRPPPTTTATATPRPMPKPRSAGVAAREPAIEAADAAPRIEQIGRAGVGKLWPTPQTAVTLIDLVAASCKFPVGTKTGAAQLFCGAVREGDDGPYCPGHHRIVVSPLWKPARRDAA